MSRRLKEPARRAGFRSHGGLRGHKLSRKLKKNTKKVGGDKRNKSKRIVDITIRLRDSLGRFVVRKSRKVSRKPARKLSRKPQPKRKSQPLRKLPRKPPRKLPRKPPRKPPRKLPRKPPRKPPRKLPRKPPRKLPRKPPRKPSRKPPRKLPRKPPRKLPRKLLRKLPRKPLRRPPRRPARKPRKRRPVRQVSERSKEADLEMQAKLVSLMETVNAVIPGLDLAIKTFVNIDGSVDGELRMGKLPEEWRSPDGILEGIALLSEIFRAFRVFEESPSMGGKFWISFGVRFGPQNDMELGRLAELYKRFRGMLQTGTYPVQAWHPTPIQNSLTIGLRTIIDGIMSHHGIPVSVILVRFIWIPDGTRPGRYQDELGGK